MASVNVTIVPWIFKMASSNVAGTIKEIILLWSTLSQTKSKNKMLSVAVAEAKSKNKMLSVTVAEAKLKDKLLWSTVSEAKSKNKILSVTVGQTIVESVNGGGDNRPHARFIEQVDLQNPKSGTPLDNILD